MKKMQQPLGLQRPLEFDFFLNLSLLKDNAQSLCVWVILSKTFYQAKIQIHYIFKAHHFFK